MIRSRMGMTAGVVIAMAVAGACSGGSDPIADSAASTTITTVVPTTSSTTTTVGPTTSTSSAIEVIDEAFLAEQAAKSWDSNRPGAVMVSVFDSAGGVVYASVGADFNNASPTPDDLFRVGSITKLFTSVAVLSLVEEGLVDLGAPVQAYVARVAIDERVTVRDLLQHSSGIPDYTEAAGYLDMLVADPIRAWSPDEVVALAPEDLDFEPGETFAYSNTNYMVLGLLIEEVTGQWYHEVVRERIIDPLEMSDTYLEGPEEGPAVFGGYHGLFGTVEPVLFDFTSIATNAWSAGAMVSTGRDLHTMMSALFSGEIIPLALVTEMTQNTDWGFGIFAPEWTSDTVLLGHDGRIPGSGTFLVHAPETGMTVFTVANADHLKVSPATGAVAAALGVPGVRLGSGVRQGR